MPTSRFRPIKVSFPPSSGDPATDSWMREVTNAINGLPISVFSTSDGPNSSGVTAPVGFVGIETGSSTTALWVKTASGSTYWSAISRRDY